MIFEDKINQLAKQQVNQNPNIQRDENGRRFIPLSQEQPSVSPTAPNIDDKIQQLAKQQTQPFDMQQAMGVQVDENGRRYMHTTDALKLLSGQHQQAYQNRQDEKRYNNNMAMNFSERYGVPVMPKTSIENLFAQVKGLKPLDVMRDERNFNRGVLESDRNFNRGVFESDRGFNYGVGRDQEMDSRYYNEQDYNRSWNEDERDYRRSQDKNSFINDEVSGLRKAIFSGMSADQALSQIEVDLNSGLYTPQQAQVLRDVAMNMKNYGDSQKRAQIDLTLSQMTPQNTSAEEAKVAVAKLGILSPAEQMKLNQEIDEMWKQATKDDPGVMDKIKGALSGGTWNNTVGTAAAGIMTVKTLIDNIFRPKPQP